MRITQNGSSFVATSLNGFVLAKGTEVFKGELKQGGFKSVYSFTNGNWVYSLGSITKDGNEIQMRSEPNDWGIVLTSTLRRK